MMLHVSLTLLYTAQLQYRAKLFVTQSYSYSDVGPTACNCQAWLVYRDQWGTVASLCTAQTPLILNLL